MFTTTKLSFKLKYLPLLSWFELENDALRNISDSKLPNFRFPNSPQSIYWFKNLERLYNCLVGRAIGCSSRWQQFLCYSGLWRCWLIRYDWCLRAVSGLSLDCLCTVSEVSQGCLLTVSGLSLDCLWAVSEMSLDCFRSVSGLSLDCLWTVSGLSPDCLWTD